MWYISGQHNYAAVCLPTHYLNEPAGSGCIMYIQNGEDPANVTIRTFESTEAVSLQPNETYKMSFEGSMFPVNGAESKAIRVESGVEIQVLVFKESYTDSNYVLSDVYEVPDSQKNATQFVTSGYNEMSCNNNQFVNQFYIVTTVHDNTAITIHPQDDPSVDIVLTSYGTYSTVSFRVDDPISSGTLITSDAPITVVSGNLCEWNPEAWGSYISSIPPITDLADNYVIPNIISQSTQSPGYSLHVVATESNTTIEFDGSVVELDSLGNSVTFECDDRREWMSLNCSKNCLAVQYSKTVRSSVHTYGMFMLPVIGASEFYTSSTFTTMDIEPQSYISIVVEGEDPGTDILLNGNSLGDLDWGTIGGYATAETSIVQGTYIMESINNRPFAVYVYSHWSVSFDYIGGAGYTNFPKSRGISTTLPPTTATPSTTTPAATPPPSEGNYTLPQLSVRLNGTVYTEDGEDMSPQCAQVLLLLGLC